LLFTFLIAASAATLPSSPAESRFSACIALVDKSPEKAVDAAGTWQVEGGGVLARQCLGIALAAQQRWAPAALAFQQAAEAAELNRDGRAARLWIQAGNAALAAGEAEKARRFLDAAVNVNSLTGAEQGEAHLDRARALAKLGQLEQARADLDIAVKLVPQDPLAWLLSATLARKMGDLARAATDIGEAAKLSPDDAGVALEAGNIAAINGAPEAAKLAWAAALKNAPESPAGKAAAEVLKQFESPPVQ
jgi:tetratricopeptide (TPR) repeat protein